MHPSTSRVALIIIGLCLTFEAAARAQVAVDTNVSFRIVNKHSALPLAGAKALWHLMPEGKNQYAIVDMGRGDLLVSTGDAVTHGPDTGAPDRLWQITDAGDGYSKIKSAATGLLLRWDAKTAAMSADDGSEDQLWKLTPAGPAYPEPNPETGDITVHDPSAVKTAAGTYYVFGTHNRIRMQSSPDLVRFTEAGQVFKEIPAWTAAYAKGDLWAPDVSFHNGKYWLYYAASSFGKNTSAIGLATSETATPGDWTDQGIVVSTQPSDDFNAIDPGLVVDPAGKWWLSFGSYWGGIQLIAIDPETGKQDAKNTTVTHLARRRPSTAIEAAYIYFHDRYYYLFVSFDQCCRGVQSTYHMAVGRSKNVAGPYVDRSGIAMADGGGSILVSSHGHIVGPGGQVVLRDGDRDLLIYHYYDALANGRRTLAINRLGWDSEGWPYLQ